MKRLIVTLPRLTSGLVLVMLALLATTACSSNEKAGEPGGGQSMMPPGATRNPYLIVLDQFSGGESDYQGFYNQFTYRATVLNHPVREAVLLKEAEYFKWSPEQLAEAKRKAELAMETETEVFMSFFTPDRRNDNMTDRKSIWRIYLDTGSQRLIGTPKKAKKEFAELQALYPYHTRWNTPYIVTFAIPAATVEQLPATFIVTGPLGTREIRIPAAR